MNCLSEVLKRKRSGLDLKTQRIPIWFMRQAGRYLPEYKKLRANFSGFMEFVHTPEAAAEATLQPLQRFDLDAAIIFSDILVIPDALGQKVTFIPGKGPRLSPLNTVHELNFDDFVDQITPTLKALSLVRDQLSADKDLIGFSGAPWTLACYMLEGSGSKNYDAARFFAAQRYDEFAELMALLTEATIQYLSAQIRSGASVVKIFDSWAGLCPSWLIELALVLPVKTITGRLKELHPDVPVIYFPRGVGEKYPALCEVVGSDAVAVDQFVDPTWLNQQLSPDFALQGGVDPMIMKAGGELLDQEVVRYLSVFKNRPYVFNLGHGMVPEMPIDHVHQTIDRVRSFEKTNTLTNTLG